MKSHEEVQIFSKYSTKKFNHRYIQTENYQSNLANQNPVSKWSQNTLYHQVKKRIHEKMKTQATNDDLGLIFPINNHFQQNRKPKSKLTVSTLQIAIDPFMRKIIQEPFPIDRKILHKPEQESNKINNQNKNISRNMSAKLVRQNNGCSSLLRKQKVLTCRKNTKSNAIFNSTSKTFRPRQMTQIGSVQLTQKVSEDFSNRFEKSKSQMSKSNSTKNGIINMQNIEKNPLLFYFKAKSSFKHSEREMSIKKIRIKSKNNKVFI